MPTRDRRLLGWQLLTLALLVVGYSGCYLCRSNFSVSLNLIADSLVAQGYEPRQATVWLGTIATIGTAAYAAGKFLAGGLADWLGGRRNVLGGMLGAVLFTLMFASTVSIPIFTLAWIGNRAAQSMCWAGMVKITGRWFSYSSYGSAMAVVSLSYMFGDAAARLFMGWLLSIGFGWREVFATAGGVLGAIWLVSFVLLKQSPLSIGCEEPPGNPLNVYGTAGEAEEQSSFKSVLVPLLKSPEFISACVISLGLTLLRDTFNTWAPSYFKEVVGSSHAVAASQSAWFPLMGGVSVLLAGWLGDRLGQGGRAAVIVAGCLGTAAVLWALAAADFATGSLMPVVLVSLVGLLMLGPYSFLAGAISLDLGGKKGGATACGIIDGVGYLGAMMAGDSVARLTVNYGWPGTFQVLAGVAVLTSLMAGVFYRLQVRRLRRQAVSR